MIVVEHVSSINKTNPAARIDYLFQPNSLVIFCNFQQISNTSKVINTFFTKITDHNKTFSTEVFCLFTTLNVVDTID